MHIVSDAVEKKQGMTVLLEHLEKKPDIVMEKLAKADASSAKMEILRLDIGEIHGKAGR